MDMGPLGSHSRQGGNTDSLKGSTPSVEENGRLNTEDSITVHIRSTAGPIDVYLCEVEQGRSGRAVAEGLGTSSLSSSQPEHPDKVRFHGIVVSVNARSCRRPPGDQGVLSESFFHVLFSEENPPQKSEELLEMSN
ncbi:hypothetical protein MC885_016299 [Smutsia gigantea]|nr:hypothetical protein MC885_016299 [Smutsia gigantea]